LYGHSGGITPGHDLHRCSDIPVIERSGIRFFMNARIPEVEPPDFMARLAAMVPRPRVNLTRCQGVFAPNSQYRARVTLAKQGGILPTPGSPRKLVLVGGNVRCCGFPDIKGKTFNGKLRPDSGPSRLNV
jgi:hypothetical protein